MLDALERQFVDPAAVGYAAGDHSIARLFDLIGAACRLAAG